MTNQVKYEDYDEFIKEAFKLLHPMILKVDKALSISIHKYDDYNKMGHVDPYGNIHIGVATIFKNAHTDQVIKNFIIESIVHELLHLDQNIDPKIMKINVMYKRDIEKQCISETARFILTNKNLIQSKLNFTILDRMFRNRITTNEFEYKSLFEVYRLKFEAAYDKVELLRILRHIPNIVVRYKENSVIRYNVKKLYIKVNGAFNPNTIYEFNKAIYNNRKCFKINVARDNTYYIDIY